MSSMSWEDYYDSDSDPESPQYVPDDLTDREAHHLQIFLNNYQGATPEAPTDDQQQQDLTCPHCDATFKTKQTLGQHLSEKHIGTVCFWPGCNANFSSEGNHITHLKEHNDAAASGENGTMTCNWPGCGKVFQRAERVSRHLRRHTVAAKKASEARSY
ncbi:hypothetical protein Hte_009338 [Hypoxylon texense]